jgi:predicted nuclease with TOPRIM domain
MANETDTPGGVSEEEKQNSVQSSAELTLGLGQSQSLSEERFAPPWIRMDPELSRAVLAKTEEELLGALSALMRNKIEHEKAQRALAHTMLEIEQARQEVAGVKRQVIAAEDELSTRLSDHGRVVDEIEQARSQLQADQAKYLEFQNELITIKNEIEEARKEKAAASAQLAELQLQHRAIRDEIESLKGEVTTLQGEQHSALEKVEPLRKELDERLAAREALIQQITTMERHIAELTSTRDIRTNAQRIALVGRGTESMRGEIQQLKAEIDRIEKERLRLASERDRVESEFAGLESRLNTARFSYAETLERLDEARAALAVTEKEHDEAVSKLEHIHEQETKPLPMRAEPAEEKRQKSEEAVVEQENIPALKEPEQTSGVEIPAREPALKESVHESVPKEPGQEPPLPLLTNEPLPVVISSWDSYRLESEFFTEEALDANRVVDLVSELPGIENVLVVRQRGAVLAGNLPQRLSDQLKAPGRDYERLFNSWPNRVQERKGANAQIVTFQVEDEFLTATQANDIILVASHERPKLQPGVEEKLAVVVEELAKMYPKAGDGIQEAVGRKPDSVSAESA